MLITMTVLAALAALASAMFVGYCCGRRSAAAPSNWGKRTSRTALGRRALHLAVLIAARRVRRRFVAEPDLLALRILPPLDLLRVGAARMRAYRSPAGW